MPTKKSKCTSTKLIKWKKPNQTHHLFRGNPFLMKSQASLSYDKREKVYE